MTASQKRALRAGYTPPPPPPTGAPFELRVTWSGGGDGEGEGQSAPTPPPTKPRARYGGLAAMLAMATLSAGSAGPPEPLPTKRFS